MRYAARLQSAMRMQARATDNVRSPAKLGTIFSYDPNRYAIQVTFQPEGNVSGWIPLGALWVGHGWGVFAAPALGAMVEVEFVDGNPEAGVCGLSFFNNADQPLAVQSGEFWIAHAKGGSFKLTNDGKVAFNDGHGAAITLNGDGTITSTANSWVHTGDIAVTGNLNVSKTVTATTDVVGGGISLKTHKTTLVQPGTGLSGVPS